MLLLYFNNLQKVIVKMFVKVDQEMVVELIKF